jgi:hypothetical protein
MKWRRKKLSQPVPWSEDNSVEDKVKIQPRRNSPLSIHGFCPKEAHRSEILNLNILSCGMNSLYFTTPNVLDTRILRETATTVRRKRCKFQMKYPRDNLTSALEPNKSVSYPNGNYLWSQLNINKLESLTKDPLSTFKEHCFERDCESVVCLFVFDCK